MKSAIFYGSQVKLSNAHKPIHVAAQPPYFVRMKVVNMGCADALEKARPMLGETVLNTVELDGGSK